MLAGEATPMSMPSMADTDSAVSSPEESSKPVVEVFELQESSGDDFSPDMDSQALFVKLKEAQCKNAVTEGELTKLKAKVIVLENTEGQKRQYEKKCEEMATRLRDTEKSLKNARIEINQYKDMMEGSQGEYIALERRMKGDFTALEKKYHKAKKLIKEYQQREKDFIAERESLLQQQTEKDQQYNALVKSLKDRIFQLEGELAEAQTAAGLPVLLPKQDSNLKPATDQPISPVTASTVRSVPPKRDSGSSLTAPLDSVSSESDVSSAGQLTPGREDQIKADAGLTFESVPTPQLLDTSVHKAKAQAANNSRRPPTKQRSKESVEGIEAQTGEDKHNESGLETWIKHDSDNTVKKSDVKKRKAQQLAADTEASQRLAAESEAAQRLVDSEATPLPVHKAPSPVQLPTPPPPPTSLPPPSESDTSETSPRHRSGSESGESSSTVSQTSYDPSNPQFRSHSEIPGLDTVSVDTGGTSHSAESESSNVSVKKSKGFLPKLPFKKFGGGDKDKGGAMLVSTRSLNTDDSEGGITLISKKKINTDLDFDGASTISDSSSGYMVGEVESTSYSFSGTPANQEHPSQMSSHSQNQIQSCGISEWTNEHVRHWLIGIEMEKYTQLFTDRSITGPQLLQLDANKLKTWGINNAKDREVFKKKFKELKIVLDKERKQLEKERRQLEKEQKAREKEQKKMSKKK